ncbi:MAG: divergent polysaccharide deacetylase family protein [Rhodospirillales bacterium]
MKFTKKLKGLFSKGRKGSGDDEDDVEDDEEEAEEEEAEDTDDDDDEEGGGGLAAKLGGRRNLIIAGAVGGLLVLGLVGGGIWMFLGSDDPEPAQAASEPGSKSGGKSSVESKLAPLPVTKPGVSRVVLDVPPKKKPRSRTAAGSLNAIAAADQGPVAGIVASPVTLASFGGLKEPAASQSLAAVPDPALIEQGEHGPLPRIGDQGRKPWRVYARPFDENNTLPRIAVIITSMGLSAAATEAAIKRLPGEVTLAFDPYGEGLEQWIAAARGAGHEVLLSLPLEPANFPIFDPGPDALMTTLKPEENKNRLEVLLSRFSGFVGVATVMGSKFSTEEKHVRPMLEALNSRGLMFVDGGANPDTVAPRIATEIGLPRVMNNLLLTGSRSRSEIDRMLAELEPIVRQKAAISLIAAPNPATLERLAAWIATFEAKKLVLAPVSAIADKQFIE